MFRASNSDWTIVAVLTWYTTKATVYNLAEKWFGIKYEIWPGRRTSHEKV